MHKEIVLAAFLFVSLSQAEEQIVAEQSVYGAFEEDITGFLTKAETFTDIEKKTEIDLPAGTEIKIIKKLTTKNTNTGVYDYLVGANKKFQAKISGHSISQEIELQGKTTKFFYSLSPESKHESLIINLIAVKDKKILATHSLSAPGTLTTYSHLKVTDDAGITGIESVLQVHFSDEYCGGIISDIYLFWDGKNFQFAKKLDSQFDAPQFYRDYFVFPNQPGGNSGKILEVQESGYYPEGSEQEEITELKKNSFSWKDNQLIPE